VHDRVFFDGSPTYVTDPAISAISSAALYGRGVFTTIAIFDYTPFLWDKHWLRLTENARRLDIDLSGFVEHRLLEPVTATALEELIGDNNVEKGRARITFFDKRSSEPWRFDSRESVGLLITTAPFRPAPQPFSLTVSPYLINSASPLAGIKSSNYLEKILALKESRQRGFHEAIQLNEHGHVSSGCMSNLFWLEGGRLYTPSLQTGCVPGTTREFVLENLDCEETLASLDHVQSADAVFMTSAGIGILPVERLDSRVLTPVTHQITDLFDRM
jgi:branched-subunit amino acid aminotransferase/4-amino-4-deoxychorismate lyase